MDNVYRFYFTKIAREKTVPRGKKYVKMETRRHRKNVRINLSIKDEAREAKGRNYEMDGGAGESH